MGRYLLIEVEPSKPRPDNLWIGYIIAFFAFCTVYYWTASIFANYSKYAMPYKPVAAFYYYTVIVPVASIVSVLNWLEVLELTPWGNFNMVIAIVGTLLYVLLLLLLYGIVFSIIGGVIHKIKYSSSFSPQPLPFSIAISLWFFPAVVIGVWFVISGALGWIFS